MIAGIIPLTRLPRHLSIFDYNIAPEDETRIELGQLVEIPFRKSTQFGLVFAIDKTNNFSEELKTITHIVHETKLIDHRQFALYERIADMYNISLATLLKTSILPLQKRKLKKLELSILPTFSSKKNKIKAEYFLYTNEKEHTNLYNTLEQKKYTLILVPEKSHIEKVYTLIPKHLKENVSIWTSDNSIKEKYETWLAIRNQTSYIIIATRSAVLIPFPHLDTIIVDFEHDNNLKHWDQTPRFHSKDILKLQTDLHHAQIIYADYSPSFEMYYDISKQHINFHHKQITQKTLLFKKAENSNVLPRIINISQERNQHNYRIFSEPVEQALLTSHGDIFIHINRKGFATSVICNDCGYIEKDPQTDLPLIYDEEKNILYSPYSSYKKPFTLTCSQCRSTLIRMIGYGTETVEKHVRELFTTNLHHNIIRIEGQQSYDTQQKTDKTRLIIGTDTAMKYIDWEKTHTIISLDVDRQLAIPEYNASEDVWHHIQHIIYHKHELSTYFIQTRNPEHIILTSLNEKDKLYRRELQKRQQLNYPPYCYIARYFFGATTRLQAETQCAILYEILQKALTKDKKHIILSNPFEMQPRYYRKQYWYALLAKIPRTEYEENLIYLNRFIPGRWKADPRPINILSP